MILLYLIIFIVFLAVLILIFDFTVILTYEDNSFRIKIRVLGIVLKIPIAKREEKQKKKDETENSIMKKFLEARNGFNRKKEALSLALEFLKGKVIIYETGITGEFGLGNAAATGIAYGSIHAFVGTIIGFLAIYHKIEKSPSINIDLNYDKFIFKLNFSLVLKLKILNLIKAIIIFNKNK
jgi:hypothetical protein